MEVRRSVQRLDERHMSLFYYSLFGYKNKVTLYISVRTDIKPRHHERYRGFNSLTQLIPKIYLSHSLHRQFTEHLAGYFKTQQEE
jgi:hypothetical protein